jgi:PPOX class probable F420-dependent enzyme
MRSALTQALPPGSAAAPGFPADLWEALRRARYQYLTTYARSGRSGTVPTWLWAHDGVVYFTTRRHSLKARRIRATGRVTVHVGRPDGPAFEGRAEWVDDRPDLEAALLRAYRRKYWLLGPLWMGRHIRRGLARKSSVLILIRPARPGPAPRPP